MFAVVSHGVDLATDVDGLLGQLQIGAQQSVGGGGDGGAVTQTHRPQLGSELIEVLVEAGPHPSSSPTSGRAKHKHHHAVESTSDPPDPTIRNLGPNKHSVEECEPHFGSQVTNSATRKARPERTQGYVASGWRSSGDRWREALVLQDVVLR
jgi:hypothetical protein